MSKLGARMITSAKQALAIADRGADGPAMQARPSGMVTIRLPDDRLSRVDVLRYHDAHLVDRLALRGQINDRQHANAAALLALWRAAGLEPKMVASIGDGPRGCPSLVDDGEAAAEDFFHREMRRFTGQPLAILVGMLRGEHPGVRWLATLQGALDRLDHLPARWGGEMWAAEDA
jgi:hypothetical protein